MWECRCKKQFINPELFNKYICPDKNIPIVGWQGMKLSGHPKAGLRNVGDNKTPPGKNLEEWK